MTILSNIKKNINFTIEVEMFRLGRFGILKNAEKVTRQLTFEKGMLSFGDYAYYILYSETRTPEELLGLWGVKQS